MKTPQEPTNEFTEASLGPDAPAKIIKKMENEFSYHAAAVRLGGILPDDFVTLTNRMRMLSDHAFKGESTTHFVANREILDEEAVVEMSSGVDEIFLDPGTELDLATLNPSNLADLLANSHRLEVTMKPAHPTKENRSAFTQVSWELQNPHLLQFYGQNGSSSNKPASEGPVQSLLTRKMFHVPDSAPGHGLSVVMGISDTLEARRPTTFIGQSKRAAHVALHRLVQRP